MRCYVHLCLFMRFDTCLKTYLCRLPTSYIAAMALLYGIEVPDIPEGLTPVECVVLVKAIGERGIVFIELSSEGLNTMEKIGMGTSFMDSMRQRMSSVGEVK